MKMYQMHHDQSLSVEPVAGSATSIQPVTPSEQTSESSQSWTAPDIDFPSNVNWRFPSDQSSMQEVQVHGPP